MEVRWSSRADSDYDHIISHLLENWTKKEAVRFIKNTEQTVQRIIQYPSIGPKSDQQPEIRKSIITKQITMFYQVKGDILHVIALWNTLQDTSKLKL